MSERAEALAARFEQANQNVLRLVSTCPAENLAAICPAEGWTASALGSHIAYSYPGITDNVIKRVVAGEPLPPFSEAMFAERNAQHAAESAAVPQEEVVSLLQDLGAATATYLRSLSDDDLDRTMSMPAMGGQPVSVEQLVDMVLIGHTNQHASSISEGLGLADRA